MRRMKLKFAPKVAAPKTKAANPASGPEAECTSGTHEVFSDVISSIPSQEISKGSQDSVPLPLDKTSNALSDSIPPSSSVSSISTTATQASTTTNAPFSSSAVISSSSAVTSSSLEETYSLSSTKTFSTNADTSINSKPNSKELSAPCNNGLLDVTVDSIHKNVSIETTNKNVSESFASTPLVSSVSVLKETNVADKNSSPLSMVLDKGSSITCSSPALSVEPSPTKSSKESNVISNDKPTERNNKREPEKSKPKISGAWSSKKIKPNLNLKRRNANSGASKSASKTSSATSKEALAVETSCIPEDVEVVSEDMSNNRVLHVPAKEASIKEKTGVPFTQTNTRSIATLSAENVASLDKANKENFDVVRSSRDSDATSLSSMDISEENRIFLERKQKFRNKLNEGALESHMTMFDLIYFNPANSPMPGRETNTSSRRRKSQDSNAGRAEQCAEEESVDDVAPCESKNDQDDKRSLRSIDSVGSVTSTSKASEGAAASADDALSVQDDQDENSRDCDFLAPRLKIGPDGELIIDQESILIKTTVDKERLDALSSEVIQESEETRKCFTKKRKRTSDWTASEIAYFYKALSTVGTDFSLMQEVFFKKWRTREELKMKFKREEKVNKVLIDAAVSDSLQYDLSVFESEPVFDADAERAKVKAAERSAVLMRKKTLQLQVQRAKMLERDQKKKLKLEDKVRKKVLRKAEKQANAVKKPRGRPKKRPNPATEADVSASPGSAHSQDRCQQEVSSNASSANNHCTDFLKVETTCDLNDETLSNSGSSVHHESNTALDGKHVEVSRTSGSHSTPTEKAARVKKPRKDKKAKFSEDDDDVEENRKVTSRSSSPVDDMAPLRRSGRVRKQRVDYVEDLLGLPSDIEVSDEDGDEDYVTGAQCSPILPPKRKRGGKNISNLLLHAELEGCQKDMNVEKKRRLDDEEENPLPCDEQETGVPQKDVMQSNSCEAGTRHVHWNEKEESSKLMEENEDSGDVFDVSMIEDDPTGCPVTEDTGPCDTSGAMRANNVSEILLDPAACLSRIDLLDVSLEDAIDPTSSKSCISESVEFVAPTSCSGSDNPVSQDSLPSTKPQSKNCDASPEKNREKKSARSKRSLLKANLTKVKKSPRRRRRTRIVLASSSEDESEPEEDTVLRDTDRLKIVEDSGSTIKIQLQGIRLDELTSPHPVKLGSIANTSSAASSSPIKSGRNASSNEDGDKAGTPNLSENTCSTSPESENYSQNSKDCDDERTLDRQKCTYSHVETCDRSKFSDSPETSSLQSLDGSGARGEISGTNSLSDVGKVNYTPEKQALSNGSVGNLNDLGNQNSPSSFKNKIETDSNADGELSTTSKGAPICSSSPASESFIPNSSDKMDNQDEVDVPSSIKNVSGDSEKIMSALFRSVNECDAGITLASAEKIGSSDQENNSKKITGLPSNSIVSTREDFSTATEKQSAGKMNTAMIPALKDDDGMSVCTSTSPVVKAKDCSMSVQDDTKSSSLGCSVAIENSLPANSTSQSSVSTTKCHVGNSSKSGSLDCKDATVPHSHTTMSGLSSSCESVADCAASQSESANQVSSTVVTCLSSTASSCGSTSSSVTTNPSSKTSDVAGGTVTTALPRRAKIKIAPKLKSSISQLRLKAARGALAGNTSANIITPETTVGTMRAGQNSKEGSKSFSNCIESSSSAGNAGQKSAASRVIQEPVTSKDDVYQESTASAIDVSRKSVGSRNDIKNQLEGCVNGIDDGPGLKNSSAVIRGGITSLTKSVCENSEIASNNDSLHEAKEHSNNSGSIKGFVLSAGTERESSVSAFKKKFLSSSMGQHKNQLKGKISDELTSEKVQSDCVEATFGHPPKNNLISNYQKEVTEGKEQKSIASPHVMKESTSVSLFDEEKDITRHKVDTMETSTGEHSDSQNKCGTVLCIEAANVGGTTNGSSPEKLVRKYSVKSVVQKCSPLHSLDNGLSENVNASRLTPPDPNIAERLVDSTDVMQANEGTKVHKIVNHSERGSMIKNIDVDDASKSPEMMVPVNFNSISMKTGERVSDGRNVVQACSPVTNTISECSVELPCAKQSLVTSCTGTDATIIHRSPSSSLPFSASKDSPVRCYTKNRSCVVLPTSSSRTVSPLNSGIPLGQQNATIHNVAPSVLMKNVIHSQGAQHAEFTGLLSSNEFLQQNCTNSPDSLHTPSSHNSREPDTIISVISHRVQQPDSKISPVLVDVRQVNSVISELPSRVQQPESVLSSLPESIQKSGSVISSLPHSIQTDSVVCNVPLEYQQPESVMSGHSGDSSRSGSNFSTIPQLRQQQCTGVSTLRVDASPPETIISAFPRHIQQSGSVISHLTQPVKQQQGSVISAYSHPNQTLGSHSPFLPQDAHQPITVISTLPHSYEHPSSIISPLPRVIEQPSPGISTLPNGNQQQGTLISTLAHAVQRPSRGPSSELDDYGSTTSGSSIRQSVIPIVRSPYLRSPRHDSPAVVVIPNQGTYTLSNPEALPSVFRNSPTIMQSAVPSPVFFRPSPSPLVYQPSPPLSVLHRSSPLVYQPCPSPHRSASGISVPNETQTHYIDPSQVFAHPVTGQRLVRVLRSSASSSSAGYLDIPAPDPLPADTRYIVVKATRVIQDGKGAWNYAMYLQKR